MASHSPVTTSASDTDDLLQRLVSGGRGRALRAQLAARNPDLDADAIEDAIQYACKSFLAEASGITEPGQVYTWIRTAATRSLGREVKRRWREVVVDPEEAARRASEEAGPAEELIELENDADLEVLVDEVASSLSERRRDVLALYGAGLKRPQIADRLGVSERVVKRDLREIMDEARAVLARLAGGGCRTGEPLVVRHVCGIASPDESAAARDHLSHCGRCELFSERLISWREKAGAMLPAPVAEGASPSMVRQIADSAGEKISVIKHHVLDGGAQVKQHAYRVADPTPLAAARPGTAAAVIASCVAIGGGAAACVEQGIDPLGAAKGLIASAPEKAPEETAPPPEAESTGPTYTPAETPVAEEPAPAPEPAQPEPQPNPQPQPEPEPGASIEPSNQYSETESEASYEATEEASPTPEPAPQAVGSGSQEFQP